MTALPDTFMPDGPLRHERLIPQHYVEVAATSRLRRSAMAIAGASALMAAAGLWLIPVVPGDGAMQLTKLALSMALAGGGAFLLPIRAADAGPEVQIDTVGRRLSIIEKDASGRIQSEIGYSVDTLSEIVLRDGLLTARDADGQPLITLPVGDASVEAAILSMLSRAPR